MGSFPDILLFRGVILVAILQLLDREHISRARASGIVSIHDKLFSADGHIPSPEFVV
jgi:hypothetical protein